MKATELFLLLLLPHSCGLGGSSDEEDDTPLIVERNFERAVGVLPKVKLKPVSPDAYVLVDPAKQSEYVAYLKSAVDPTILGVADSAASSVDNQAYFQVMISELDSKVRDLGDVERAPEPIALMTQLDPSVAAMVPTITYCLEIPVSLEVSYDAAAPPPDLVLSVDYSGQIVEKQWDEICVNRLVSAAPAPDALLASGAKSLPNICSGTFASDAIAIKCSDNPVATRRYRGFAFKATTQYVLVNPTVRSRFTQNNQEPFLAFLVAHELGHFYEGPVYWGEETQNFYKLSDRDWPLPPVPNPSVRRAGLDAFYATAGGRSAENLEILLAANANRLGWYTTEDRAHEFAVNLLAEVGVDASFAARFFLSITPKSEPEFAEGLDACIKRYNNLWQGSDGKLDPPPLGYFSYHHSFCFESFSIDQQILGNGYDRAVLQPKEGSVVAAIASKKFGLLSQAFELPPLRCGNFR